MGFLVFPKGKIALIKKFSPESERLCWCVGVLKVELHQHPTFSPGTLAFRQESWTVDRRDAISVDFRAVLEPIVEHSMPATALAILMVCVGHFLVLESKMSFLWNNGLVEWCDGLDCCYCCWVLAVDCSAVESVESLFCVSGYLMNIVEFVAVEVVEVADRNKKKLIDRKLKFL
jgi:hypothetical protein